MFSLKPNLELYISYFKNLSSIFSAHQSQAYPDLPVNLVTEKATVYTLLYVATLYLLNRLGPLLGRFRLFTGVIQLTLQTLPTLLYLVQFNPTGLLSYFYNLSPLWARHYIN